MAEKQGEQATKTKQAGNGNPSVPQMPSMQPIPSAAQKQQTPLTQDQQSPPASLKPRMRTTPTTLGGQKESSLTPTFVSPFSLMRRLAEEMDSVLEEFGFPRASTLLAPSQLEGRGRTPMAEGMWEARAWVPQVEVFEREGQLLVRADLPGMDLDDIRVNVTDDAITIEGERVSDHQEEGGDVYRSERTYGSFYRAIPLPVGVDPTTITAVFDNGVLEVAMKAPESPRQQGRKVEIQGSSAGAPLAESSSEKKSSEKSSDSSEKKSSEKKSDEPSKA